MSYIKRFGDGFDFNNLGRAVGLRGFKPMLRHFEDGIGLHGFNAAGKAHGTNVLGGALLLGGNQLMSYFGNPGATGGSGGPFGGFEMKDAKRAYDFVRLFDSMRRNRQSTGNQQSYQANYQPDMYRNSYGQPAQQPALPLIMGMGFGGMNPAGLLGMLARM